MNKKDSIGGGSCDIDGVSDMVEVMNMIVTRARKGGYLLSEKESGVKDEAEIFCRES